jgi:CRP/FNR family cyclic AMP-dependent transcriptional regulator
MRGKRGVDREMLATMAEGFLQLLSGEEAAAFRAVGHERAYGANVTLVHQGDDAGSVMLVLRGRVKIVRIADGGREAILAVRGEGDLIGELSAIDGASRSTSVTTLQPVEVLLVPRSDFQSLLEQRPRLALVILRLVAAGVRYAGAQQAELGTHDVVGRLAQRLLEMSERFGVTRERGIDIELPLSQEELASWIGASREAVSKAFHVLRSLRIVETGRRRITILDVDALRRRGL